MTLNKHTDGISFNVLHANFPQNGQTASSQALHQCCPIHVLCKCNIADRQKVRWFFLTDTLS